MLDNLHGSVLWSMATTLWDCCYFYPHYRDEETETQRSLVTQTLCGKARMVTQTQTWSQPWLATFTDLLLWKGSSTCSNKSYRITWDLIVPVLKMEIPTRKPQPPPSLGGVCFLWRQLQKEKWAILFWFLMMIAFGFSGSWQVQLVPGKCGPCSQQAPKTFQRHKLQGCWHVRGSETKGCKAFQVRYHLWLKEPRLGRTQNSRIVVLNWGWGWFCSLGDILAMSRDTFELSQLGVGLLLTFSG